MRVGNSAGRGNCWRPSFLCWCWWHRTDTHSPCRSLDYLNSSTAPQYHSPSQNTRVLSPRPGSTWWQPARCSQLRWSPPISFLIKLYLKHLAYLAISVDNCQQRPCGKCLYMQRPRFAGRGLSTRWPLNERLDASLTNSFCFKIWITISLLDYFLLKIENTIQSRDVSYVLNQMFFILEETFDILLYLGLLQFIL